MSYHLEVSKSRLWWPTLDQSRWWSPKTIALDERVLLRPLPFPVLAKEVAASSFLPADSVKLLGAPIGEDALVHGLIRERMARVDDLQSAVESMGDPHVSTEMLKKSGKKNPAKSKFLIEKFS